MASVGFASVNLRKELAHVGPPLGLLSVPRDFAAAVAEEYVASNPGKSLRVTPISDGVVVRDPNELWTSWRNISQRVFTDDDISWYLDRKKIKAAHLIPLIDGNLELLAQAKLAYPHMDYFVQTLLTGTRMKKSVHQVQPCIMIAVHNTRFEDMELPIPVIDYVLNKTPRYGWWLEQHIDKFYELIRRHK